MERPSHVWTTDKLDFLEAYIPAFVRATMRAKTIHYVDGFAGPGLAYIKETGITRRGSPLIALNQEFDSYHLVELQKSKFAALQNHVEQHHNGSRAVLYPADFNQVVQDITRKIHPLAPTFYFLDPEGLELNWSTVEHIGKRQKADIFILISASGVMRNAPKPSTHQTLTRFYGGDEWKQAPTLKKAGTKWFEVYSDIYLQKLKGLGLTYSDKFLIARNRNGAAMHILVFASKNNVALKIAQHVLSELTKREGEQLLF